MSVHNEADEWSIRINFLKVTSCQVSIFALYIFGVSNKQTNKNFWHLWLSGLLPSSHIRPQPPTWPCVSPVQAWPPPRCGGPPPGCGPPRPARSSGWCSSPARSSVPSQRLQHLVILKRGHDEKKTVFSNTWRSVWNVTSDSCQQGHGIICHPGTDVIWQDRLYSLSDWLGLRLTAIA